MGVEKQIIILITENDRSITRIVNAEISMDDIAPMENKRLIGVGIRNLKADDQTVRRTKMLHTIARKRRSIDLVFLGTTLHCTKNEDLLPYPSLVELPKVELGLTVVEAFQRGALFARKIMIKRRPLERALKYHRTITRSCSDGFVKVFLVAETESGS